MIIAICTPLMSRVHKCIKQAEEVVFCDSTSTLDRFNTSLFILSTSHPTGGMPLAVMITSDEQEETLLHGLSMLKGVLPKEAFHGRGVQQGPMVVMTDDSLAERNALHSVWPATRRLLCVFHFLQAKWTWLHDGQNQIANEDRSILLNKTKMMVYADTEDQLFRFYNEFQQSDVGKKYPHYSEYIKSQWDRRKEWALCYRKKLLVRGNHTNNYAEAGIRILKDLVFSRVKAYNLVQMFSFVTECLELYYTRKILSVAHNRFDRHISLKFQGLKCLGISLAQVQKLDESNLTYLVSSQSERGVSYLVDMKLGVCSCIAGQDGSPCSHQAAIINLFKIPSVNCIPSQSPETRRILAEIAIGPKAIQDPTFYSSLHEKQKCDDYAIAENGVGQPDLSDFSGTAWNLVRSEADNSDTPDSDLIDFKDPTNSRKIDVDAIVKQIQEFADDITTRVKENAVVAQGMQTFLRRYQNLTQNGTFQNARLSSALHRFGWVFGGTIRSSQGGYMRRGRRIPVNAKAAGRRRKFVSRGKAKLPSGRPKGMKIAQYQTSRYQFPCCKQPPGKRLHSLQANILSGTQNAGKW